VDFLTGGITRWLWRLVLRRPAPDTLRGPGGPPRGDGGCAL